MKTITKSFESVINNIKILLIFVDLLSHISLDI